MTRDARTKQAFIAYLHDPEHADWRFWQCVRNFSRYSAIAGVPCGNDEPWPEGWVDTFSIEADREQPTMPLRLPRALLEAMDAGELTVSQLCELVRLEAESIGLTYAEALVAARTNTLPHTPIGWDIESHVKMLEHMDRKEA